MHALFLNFVMLLLCRHAEQLALHNAQATNSNAMVARGHWPIARLPNARAKGKAACETGVGMFGAPNAGPWAKCTPPPVAPAAAMPHCRLCPNARLATPPACAHAMPKAKPVAMPTASSWLQKMWFCKPGKLYQQCQAVQKPMVCAKAAIQRYYCVI